VSLLADNRSRLQVEGMAPIVADARRPPFRARTFDRVLVDAPCSGFGAFRRRPDARWRVDEVDVDRLVEVQCALVDATIGLVKPGGTFVYSVCTLPRAETLAVDEHVRARHPHFEPFPGPASPWRPLGRGALLLPQAAGTDGMYVLRLHHGSRNV
jgi:16S rRNA (cytosine967-C5)-methyltransferase